MAFTSGCHRDLSGRRFPGEVTRNERNLMSLLTVALVNLVLSAAVVAGLAAVTVWPLVSWRPVRVASIERGEQRLSRAA
jgi:hypothetical protein